MTRGTEQAANDDADQPIREVSTGDGDHRIAAGEPDGRQHRQTPGSQRQLRASKLHVLDLNANTASTSTPNVSLAYDQQGSAALKRHESR